MAPYLRCGVGTSDADEHVRMARFWSTTLRPIPWTPTKSPMLINFPMTYTNTGQEKKHHKLPNILDSDLKYSTAWQIVLDLMFDKNFKVVQWWYKMAVCKPKNNVKGKWLADFIFKFRYFQFCMIINV